MLSKEFLLSREDGKEFRSIGTLTSRPAKQRMSLKPKIQTGLE